MNYNVKIGLTRAARQPTFQQTSSYWRAASASYTTPPSERPASYWYEGSWPKRSDPPPGRHATGEEWSGPYTWSGKDKWAEPTQQDGERKQAEEERKAAKHEKRKRQMLFELPQQLAVALSTILQLDAAIEQAEVDKKAADDFIERMDIMIDDEGPFWETIYERNIKLNTLRREHATTMNEYRKLYRILKKLDPKQGEEAREIYKGLKKQRGKEEGPFQTNSAKHHDQGQTGDGQTCHQAPEYHQENIHRHPEKVQPKKETTTLPSDPFSPFSDTFTSATAMDGSADHEWLPSTHTHANADSDHLSPLKQTFPSIHTMDGSVDDQGLPSAHTCSEAADDDFPTDDEIILFEIRKIHARHKDIQGEFWDISPETDICCYCGNTSTVMLCPHWEVCGLRACEYCKNLN